MRYFVGYLIIIGLLIVFIIVLFTRGGDGPRAPEVAPRPLISYASTGAEAVMTIDGPVNAASEHRQIRISVGRSNVTYEEIQGYEGNVTERRNYENSQAAYEVFLSALNLAGFREGATSAQVADERGRCPLGNRFIFQLVEGGESIHRLWSTSCRDVTIYLGNAELTIELFQRQVPNYNEVAEDVEL